MQLDTLVVGPYGVNCYVVSADGVDSCVVIDPGGDSDVIQDCLESRGQRLETVFLTHSHFDHAIALPDLLSRWDEASLACHPVCGDCIGEPRLNLSPAVVGEAVRLLPPKKPLEDGARLVAGGLDFEAYHVPGHAPGHLAFYLEEEESLFSGDLVLMGSIGRSDLPGGDEALLVRNIKALFGKLPVDTIVYAGHGPASSVGDELAGNPFLQA